LSRIVGRGLAPAEIQYTEYGIIAQQQLLNLTDRYPDLQMHHYVIMPNHIHALLILGEHTAGASPRPTLSDIVCTFKSLTTRECNKSHPIGQLLQTSFYEHVVRNQVDYDALAEYIVNNPKQWELDKLYCEN